MFASGTEHEAAWSPALKEWNVTRSPVVDEWRAEGQAAALVAVLESRFQSVPADLATSIQGIKDLRRLNGLVAQAATAPSLDAFRAAAGL